MRNVKKMLLTCCIAIIATSCNTDDNGYKSKINIKVTPAEKPAFDRYEKVLFDLDTADFQAELISIQDDYKPFLGGDLSDPEAVKYLKDFAIDPYMIELYQKVNTAFPNLDFVEKTVNDVFAHFHHHYPDILLPKKVFTCITGVTPETPPVLINGDNLLISLDWYLNKDEIYDRFGVPKYISERTAKEYMAKDIAFQLYMAFIYRWRKEANLADEMVNEGRIDYFIEAMAPQLPDNILLGYSAEQMEWANNHEGELWADIVGKQRLYSTGLDMHMTFLADGPFTQEYSKEAPARLAEFLGLKIVRSYMSRHDVTLNQLMTDNDLQGIFQNSGYKPKK